MGPISNLMGMVPGMAQQMKGVDTEVDEGRIDRLEGIIHSMTEAERAQPEMIDGSRRMRIAQGSGTQVAEVTQLVKQFREMKKMMKQMGGGPRGKKKRGKKGRKGGGRTTQRGPAPLPKKGLSLPGLGENDPSAGFEGFDLGGGNPFG